MTFRVAKTRERSDGTMGWRVIEEIWKEGSRKDSSIRQERLVQFGFRSSMSLEEARDRAKTLNAQTQVERSEERRKLAAIKRVERDLLFQSAYLPPEHCTQFEDQLRLNAITDGVHDAITGKKRNSLLRAQMSHWHFVKAMIVAVNLPPHDWSERRNEFYRYFMAKEISPSYVTKILQVLNMYGKFVAKREQRFFDPVPCPRGKIRAAIESAYRHSDKEKKNSAPLLPEQLAAAGSKFTEAESNWLECTVWFGLRPDEADGLSERNELGQPTRWQLERDDNGIDILVVYQVKLVTVREDDRWKRIPIIFDEQREVLKKLLASAPIKSPSVQKIKKHISQLHKRYGGRKGFVDLMLSREQKLEDISMWLGHKSIETTWKNYKNKQRVSYTLPVATPSNELAMPGLGHYPKFAASRHPEAAFV